jgi:DNA-3-methyladenine glycosylase I
MSPHPNQITPTKLADYLEAMSRAVFQSGISWSVIEKKWPGIRAAFDEFDPQTVASYGPDEVDRLMADAHVVRNRRKIEAIIENAREMLVTEAEFGGFDKYLASLRDNDALVKDLHRRFAFLGPSVAHFFLFGLGWDLTAQDAWAHEHFAGSHWAEGHESGH